MANANPAALRLHAIGCLFEEGILKPLFDERVRDDMDVDVPGFLDDAVGRGGPAQPTRKRVAPGDADDHLRGVVRMRIVEQGLRDVLADDLMIGAAQLLDELALLDEQGGVGAGQPVLGGDVHGDEVASTGRPGHTGPAPQQLLAFGPAGQRNDHTLARLPFGVDVVLLAVGLERLVHAPGQPKQGQLAQGGEVADAEVVAQGRIHAVGLVDESGGQTLAKALGRQIYQLDLGGGAQHLVRHGLLLRAAGDLAHHVIERFDVLHVDGGDHVDAGIEQVQDILPALLVHRSGRVGVGELVDERHLRMPFDDLEQVHLLEPHATVAQPAPRHHLEPFGGLGRGGAPVGLQQGDDHVLAVLLQAMPLPEHRARLAHAWRGAQQHPERSSCLCHIISPCIPRHSNTTVYDKRRQGW
ncbi:hypothetical protein JS530_00935 [Bifidobacterium sp. LC6]|uniref:Uncharacterized protein n=1 Tax=Bifidobacterium colobi TaxID=2809026 RepID=A0ABS5UTV3_9BIFI|nr:hypothetical protein [Bifidobacterium colobi]